MFSHCREDLDRQTICMGVIARDELNATFKKLRRNQHAPCESIEASNDEQSFRPACVRDSADELRSIPQMVFTPRFHFGVFSYNRALEGERKAYNGIPLRRDPETVETLQLRAHP